MTEIQDFYTILNDYLSSKAIIQQCIIKDYKKDDDKATCSVIIPNPNDDSTNKETLEYKNISCYIGSAVDITYQDFMSGILISLQNEYQSAQDINQQTQAQSLDYFNIISESMIAIIIPNNDVLKNLLTFKIISKDSGKIQSKTLYIGDSDNNLVLEMTNLLDRLTTFFDNLSQYTPTLSSYPADGAAKLQAEAQDMKDFVKKIHDKFKPVSDYKDDDNGGGN